MRGAMNRLLWLFLPVLSLASPLVARGAEATLSPRAQKHLDAQKKVVAEWAALPEVVSAVKAQNQKGPPPEMTNEKWKLLRARDPMVKALQENAAAKVLSAKVAAGPPQTYCEVFLSAAKGEKVALLSKTSYYLHQGKPKFDVPFTTGKSWQGALEFDESSQQYSVQISVPVLDGGTPIGVLVVGLMHAALEK